MRRLGSASANLHRRRSSIKEASQPTGCGGFFVVCDLFRFLVSESTLNDDPLLCATIAAPTMAALRAARDAADADLLELRLDKVDCPDVAGALEGRRRPAIVTCRAHWEGGDFHGSEEERRRILEHALSAGAEYVDVEAAATFTPDLIRARAGRGIVVSRHDFEAPPKDIEAAYRHLRSLGAEISKLAVAVDTLSESLPFFALGSGTPEPHVLLAMGAAGLPSRVLAARLGSRWTYVGDGIAPGQVPADRMLRHLRFRRIRPDAKIYGVVGKPVGHSRSPIMHNAGFAALGLNATYLPLEAATAEDLVTFARTLSLGGVSITAPFKISLMPFVDEVEPIARRVGAINTIVNRDGRWIGTNTDVEGFLAPLSGRLPLPGARASILGAGGSARALAIALTDHGADVTIAARNPDAAREVAELVGGRIGAFPPPPGTWDLLVNTIPGSSMPAGSSPMGTTPLDGTLVYDLVYEPEETALLADARAAGCGTIGGLEMLVAQAERQFELWTGQRPPAGIFADAARSATGVRTGDRDPRVATHTL
jgi:3-dehydroquinate dehydratase / shikimate dehydrogenase